MGSTYHATGSADAFLSDRGFDDKWVHKEERKKDIWEDVKTNKKKQMSGAEKRARAAKISEQTLKNADAVRVDIDGQVMNRLLEKQARKEGMGEKGQEPKPQSNGTAKPKKDLAPAPKKEKEVPFVTSVPLPAKKVRAELSSFMAAHETTYAQVIALSELMHEAFEPHRIDLTWTSHVDVSASTRSWLNRPASLLPEDSIGAIVEWLDHIPQKHVKELFEFLVEHGLSGGGKLGRGGDKEYLGIKALLQIMLQRVKGGGGGGSWHDAGLALGAYVATAERRLAPAAVPSVLWMVVQLAQQDALAALNCYFLHLQPVLEHERAAGGKVALQCATVLTHLLAKLGVAAPTLGSNATPPLSTSALLRLLKLCMPMTPADLEAAAEARVAAVTAGGGGGADKCQKGAGADVGAGVEVSSKNKEAVEALRLLLPALLGASAMGMHKHACAFGNLPLVLPVVGAVEDYSRAARAQATSMVLGMLSTDAAAFKVWVSIHETHLAATTHVVSALEASVRSGGNKRSKEMKAGLAEMRAQSATTIGALQADVDEKTHTISHDKNQALAQNQTNAKKVHKKVQKIKTYQHLVSAIDKTSCASAGRGWSVVRCVCWLMLLCVTTLVALGYVAANDTVCIKKMEPFVLEMVDKGAAFDFKGNEPAMVLAVTVCQKRVEIVLTRQLRTIAAEARRLANDVQALLSPMAERAQTQVTRMVEQASVLMKQHMS